MEPCSRGALKGSTASQGHVRAHCRRLFRIQIHSMQRVLRRELGEGTTIQMIPCVGSVSNTDTFNEKGSVTTIQIIPYEIDIPTSNKTSKGWMVSGKARDRQSKRDGCNGCGWKDAGLKAGPEKGKGEIASAGFPIHPQSLGRLERFPKA